jgi:hypothetical protein
MNVETGRQKIIILFWKWEAKQFSFPGKHKSEQDIYCILYSHLYFICGIFSPPKRLIWFICITNQMCFLNFMLYKIYDLLYV